ncbi:LA2681 family HEPN domain-containing protein [Rhodopseudomonas sp.]|uniref:LA2681 family HEPN domain-containing protein n=1 Tax=Rhodopseudomonas sp. TaxID=1078 RepID=UPI0039E51440
MYDPELQETSEPDAAKLYTIRNRLEHSYLKLHEIGSGNRPDDLFHDRMARSIGFEDFKKRTLRAL